MGAAIRPVVEVWGQHIDYGSRDVPIHDLIEQIGIAAGVNTDACGYGDHTVVWIEDGKAFLDFLEQTPLEEILEQAVDSPDADEHALEVGQEDYQAQVADVQNLKAMAASWRESIDLKSGCLRFYCD